MQSVIFCLLFAVVIGASLWAVEAAHKTVRA